MSELKIRPIRTAEELDQVIREARANEHVVLAPTHVVTCLGEVRGALSFVPSVLVWMHTQRNKARDSLEVKQFVENHLGSNGVNFFCLPCSVKSPYHPLLPKAGYVDVGEFTLFMKGLQ
jgi:hypothetical protein